MAGWGCVFALVLPLSVSATAAEPAKGGEWIDEGQVRVRIIDAGPTGESTHRLGFEIDLAEGWKTYWRHPGETGVAPAFAWSQSLNVAAVEPRFPAPQRFIDSGAVSFGYKTDVVLPLDVTLKRPGPALVHLDVTYAICADICLPLQATFEISLSTEPDARLAFRVQRALRTVPAADPPAVLGEGIAVTPAGDGADALKVVVPLAGAKAERIDVFADSPQGWHLPPLEPASGPSDSKAFRLDLSSIPAKQRENGMPLTFTVVHPAGSFEQAVDLRGNKVSAAAN